jgi:hypothetical protein
MRTRAYRPEVVACLENRTLLSGAASHPVVLPFHRLNFVATQMRAAFRAFTQNYNIPSLRSDIADVGVLLPFAQVDGLGVKLNAIVTTMQQNRFTDPNAGQTAINEMIAATRAQVEARVKSGDVTVTGSP